MIKAIVVFFIIRFLEFIIQLHRDVFKTSALSTCCTWLLMISLLKNNDLGVLRIDLGVSPREKIFLNCKPVSVMVDIY